MKNHEKMKSEIEEAKNSSPLADQYAEENKQL